MKVSYKWLSEYVDLRAISPQQLAEKLTSGGLAVDGVEPRNQGVTGVVVGVVQEMERHPDADRLNVCQVDAGQGELLQIVCGAQNVKPGIKVPVALVGAKLPGDKEIKRAKLRGVASSGMLCSASEIGLDTRLLPQSQTSGLYILPDDAVIGTDIVEVLHLDDFILDVDLTPNRSDCLSVRGLAYEIAALLGTNTTFPSEVSLQLPDAPSPVRVQLESERCVRYDALVLGNVGSVPSPLWMQMRLMAMGVRPIDVIVDVTNYVMLEWGQPLHAFDAGTIAESTIVVRQARPGETLITLDGVERHLDEDMLVIADPVKAIGLAGVMGGANSEISLGTTSVVIESARFDAPSTRRTGQKLGLRSEAQQRFEKGIDPAAVRNALLRATQLLIELAGGQVSGGVATAQRDVGASTLSRVVKFSPSRCRDLLGCDIPDEVMRDLFRNLGFTVTLEGAEWAVNVPSRRPDISLQADLVEEIARLYGYDNIPSTLPTGPVTTAARDARQRLLEHVRNALVTRGMYEVRTYAFTSPEVYEALGLEEGHPLRKMIPLAYPMSDERRVLRTHMLPSLGEVARHNLSHRVDGGAIFEFGRCYEAREWPIQTQPREREVIAMMWFGSVPDSLYERARAYDFFDAKGAIEQLVTGLGIAVQYERAQVSWLHPGRSAAISSNGVVIGYVGEIHPSTAAAYDLQTSVYAELDVEMLLQQRPGAATVEALPRFPGARRDLALLVNKDVLVGQMLNEISKVSQVHEILRSARVFDVYAGQGVAADQKSVALALHFGANERTLTDAEMEEVVQDVIASLQDKFDARLRA
ncbi:phenylalanine--tRNA ligase subunit beta [Alicyclobacillus fastidiosus]|uniref:Phenylalanine--tRNA ligase beta subunit n=2 Tax=Alicyclobacillus fastidiosus TaxID=392011 RepID=A0ABY6ZNE1_9BACL|nr:phenylalanine--tRNA ligase subunit beta [Alicyclobacillus fastidiosus]WAH43619.1 phenylalanine--tRNA ligase subunit beta [Alicyclobacillus fastidiosus]